MQSVSFNTGEKVLIKATILDAGTPPVAFDVLPEGATLTFESSAPNIGRMEVRPDGLSAYIRSDGVGGGIVTVKPGGTIAAFPADQIEFTIINAQPGQLNLTVSLPESEAEAPPADTGGTNTGSGGTTPVDPNAGGTGG